MLVNGLSVLRCATLMAAFVLGPPTQAQDRFDLMQMQFSHGSIRDSTCRVNCTGKRIRPVCGTDGRTYGNSCEIKRLRRCDGRRVSVQSKGRCTSARRISLTSTTSSRSSMSYNCMKERDQALEKSSNPASGVYVPDCNADGSFAPVQCHVATGYCWCVTPDGRPVPRPSVRGRRINCRQPTKGCNPQDRATFNRNLIQLFSEEYARIPKPTPPTYPGAPKGLPIESGSDALLDTPEKRVIEWKFSELDDNKDNQLRRKEIRSLKRMVKKLVKPKPCAKTFYEYCDIDNNRRIARSEWSVCLGVDTNNGHPDSTGAHADSSSYNTQNSRNNGEKRRRNGRRRQRGDRSRSNGRRRDGRRRSNGRTRDGGSAADGGSLLESPFTAPHLLRPSSETADETADVPGPTLYSERDGESSRQPGEPQDDIMIMKLTPQDDDGGDSANDEGSTIRNCQDERRKAEENDKNDPEGHIFIPNCAPGHSGHYMPAQCHDNYCWCVTVTTGKPIRGTSSHMVEPDCTNVRPKDYKGCPYSKKKKFLVGLLDEMTTEMMEFASNTSNTRQMPEPNPNHTMEEEVVRWKLWHLDLNNNGVLEKREWNSFKQLVKTEDTLRGHLRKCSRNFIRFCDANEDKSIDMEEWLECMGINEQKQRGNLPDNPKRKGPNPFSKYLRS